MTHSSAPGRSFLLCVFVIFFFFYLLEHLLLMGLARLRAGS